MEYPFLHSVVIEIVINLLAVLSRYLLRIIELPYEQRLMVPNTRLMTTSEALYLYNEPVGCRKIFEAGEYHPNVQSHIKVEGNLSSGIFLYKILQWLV